MAGAGKPGFAQLHDLELCGRVATGESAAFGELVRRHGPAVRGLLRRMGAPTAEADDLARDAFLTAFEQIAEFHGEGTFAAWVRRIAARLWLRRLQKTRRLAALVEAPDPGPAPIADHLDLDAGLSALSPVERLCVALCFGAGLSHAEAAESLNLPLRVVKSHIKRGVEKLRKLSPGTANRT